MNNIRIFEVGGSIRNELLNQKPKDRDYAVLAPSYDAMKQYLVERGAHIYQERPQFVSIKAKLPELGAVDFTLARKESFYTDARHPDSVSPAESIEEDLARRDFTMNAIAREVGTTTLIDPFDGQKYIKQGTVHTVGRAQDRFNEDRLRIFRAVRFATVLNFGMSFEVIESIKSFNKLEQYDAVSAEMIQIELWKAFSANTIGALSYFRVFPYLEEIMAGKGIRLKPTLEK
jgi:tRNA nucleotidyltransferase (CCA-adding enzyme)